MLQTTTVVDDTTIQKTDTAQGDGYSSSISADFLNAEYMQEQPLSNTDTVVLENTGVIDISALSEQELQSSAASNLFAVYRANKIQSEFPECDHIMDMFPSLFFYGRGGPGCANRSKKISLEKWVQHLLTLAGRRFATHYAFMFAVFSIHISIQF